MAKQENNDTNKNISLDTLLLGFAGLDKRQLDDAISFAETVNSKEGKTFIRNISEFGKLLSDVDKDIKDNFSNGIKNLLNGVKNSSKSESKETKFKDSSNLGESVDEILERFNLDSVKRMDSTGIVGSSVVSLVYVITNLFQHIEKLNNILVGDFSNSLSSLIKNFETVLSGDVVNSFRYIFKGVYSFLEGILVGLPDLRQEVSNFDIGIFTVFDEILKSVDVFGNNVKDKKDGKKSLSFGDRLSTIIQNIETLTKKSKLFKIIGNLILVISDSINTAIGESLPNVVKTIELFNKTIKSLFEPIEKLTQEKTGLIKKVLRLKTYIKFLTAMKIGYSIGLLFSSFQIEEERKKEIDDNLKTFTLLLKEFKSFSENLLETIENLRNTFLNIVLTSNIILVSLSFLPILFLGIYSLLSLVGGIRGENEYKVSLTSFIASDLDYGDISDGLDSLSSIILQVGFTFLNLLKLVSLSIPLLFGIKLIKSAIDSLFSLLILLGRFSFISIDEVIFKQLTEITTNLATIFKKFFEISVLSLVVGKSSKLIETGLNSIFSIFWGDSFLNLGIIDFEHLNKTIDSSNKVILEIDELFKNLVEKLIPNSKTFISQSKVLNKSINNIFTLFENIIKKSNKIGSLSENAIKSISYISIVIDNLLKEFDSFLKVERIYLSKIMLTEKILGRFIRVIGFILFAGFLSIFANLLFKPLNMFVIRLVSFLSILQTIKDTKSLQKKTKQVKILFINLAYTLIAVIIGGLLSIPATMALIPLSIFVLSLSLFLKLLSTQLTTITKGLFVLKGISFVMFLLSISLLTFSLASKSLSIGTMMLSLLFIGGLIGISALAGLVAPYLTAGIASLVGLSLVLPLLGLGLLLFAGAIKVWSGDMVKNAILLFIGILPAMLIFGVGGLIAVPGLLLLGIAFSVLSVGLLLLALAVSIWSVTKLADSMADIFLKIRLGIEALLERKGGIRSAIYNIPILGTYMQMWDSVVQSIGLLMLGVAFTFLGIGLILLGVSVSLWKMMGTADVFADIMKKIRMGIEALLERPNLQGSGIYSVPLFGSVIQLFDSVLQSIGLLVIGVAMTLLGVGLILLGASITAWKMSGVADTMTDIMKKIRMGIEALLERPNLQGSGVYSVPFFGSYIQLFDSVLQSIGLLVIGVSMSLLGVGLLLLGLSVMLWKGKNLSDDFQNIMLSIREGINNLLTSGNLSTSGIYDVPIIGTFMQLFDSVMQSVSIVLISVSLLILSLALTTLGKSIENWSGEKVAILPSIMQGIRSGIDVLLNGSQSGNSIETVSTGSQTIDSILKLISVTSQSIGIIFISGALILLAKALEFLGIGIDKIGDKYKQFPSMMQSINEGINILIGEGEGGTFDNGILGAAAGLVIGNDNVDAGGKVAKMVALSGGLILLGKSFKVLGTGLSSFPENAINIFSDISLSIKNLSNSISEEIVNNLGKLSEPLISLGNSFKVFGQGISQISYGLSRISWSESEKSPLMQFSEGIKKLLGDLSNIPIGNLQNVPDILNQVGQSLKIFGFGVSEISYGLSRLKWDEGSSPMLQFGDGLIHIFNSLGNENINDKNIKNFTTITDQFVKFSKSANGFKSFKDTFKEFVKDFKTFTETLNNIDITKLKGWTSFNKISFDIISNKGNKTLEQYSEEMKGIIRAFFEELNAREERLSAMETTGDTFNYERFRQIMLEVLQGLNTGTNKGISGNISSDVTLIAEKIGQTIINYINKQR